MANGNPDLDIELPNDQEFEITINIADFYLTVSVDPAELDAATNPVLDAATHQVRHGTFLLRTEDLDPDDEGTTGCDPTVNPCIHLRSFS